MQKLNSDQKDAVWRLFKLSLITAFVVAVGFLPVVGMGGLAAKAGADSFTTLPADFELPDAPDASTLYASDGKTIIATFGDQYRIHTEHDDIAKVMREAIVATEDTRFYKHEGVDSKGVARALVANFNSGGVSEGASTITMQYVRQVLVYSAVTQEERDEATATTPERKLREMRYAVSLEKQMSKEEILTAYLNTVYFGHGAYGVGAAAKVYFGKSASDLNLNEAATLAGLVQSPSEYDPINNDPDAAEKRRNYVLASMVNNGYVDKAKATKVGDSEIELNPGKLPGDAVGADGSEYGFFADYFEEWWSQQEQFGDTPQERLGLLSRGGYDIVSTLDVDMQKAAEESIAAQQPKDSPFALGTAAVEPGTGKIKVMAVNREFSADESKPENTTNPLLSGGNGFSGYQAGSTFKMFTMLAALKEGKKLDTSYHSPHKYQSQYIGGQGESACGIHWCPSNADPSMTGNHTMWSGFGQSVNTYFVQLEEEVGAEKAVEMAETLGMEWHNESDRNQAQKAEGWGAFTLGVSATTPLELATAYATVAAEGKYADPIPVSKLYDGSGEKVSVKTHTKQVIDKEVARAATDAARCPTGYGAATGSCGNGGTATQVSQRVPAPVAGKTGTTDGDSTAWFAGFTPNLTVASFMADPANPSNLLPQGMSQKPITLSADVLAKGWEVNPGGEFTPPEKLVGNGGKPSTGDDDWWGGGNDGNGNGNGNGNDNGGGDDGSDDGGGDDGGGDDGGGDDGGGDDGGGDDGGGGPGHGQPGEPGEPGGRLFD